MTIYDRIFNLANQLAKNLSKEEGIAILKNVDYLSEETKNSIEENLSEPNVQEHLERLKQIEVEKDWQKTLYRLQEPKRKKIPSLYKAAAIALILLTGSYFTYYRVQKPEPQTLKHANISPGTDKAVLILEDGLQIALGADKTFKNKYAESQGERLQYHRKNLDGTTTFNYLVVPRGGQYQVQLADGTVIWLNADTKIKYPVAFQKGETRIVELIYGEVYMDVSPSSEHQGDAFKIIAKEQEVNVVGTQFNLKAYDDETRTYTTLVEGRVNIKANEKHITLHPGEQSIFDPLTNQLTKKEVDVNHHTSWIRGYFHFQDKPLKEIMQVLARWYDIKISFGSDDLEKMKFSGLLSKKQTIEEILNGIKNTNTIHAYEIKNNTVTIK